MKRRQKIKKEIIDLHVLRQELYARQLEKIHPIIKKNLQIDGVLDEVCNHLVDLEFQDRRLPYPSRGLSDFTRLHDYKTDLYIHVHYKSKNYRFNEKEIKR